MSDDEWGERFGRKVAAAFADPERPYRRPGSDLLLNDDWWGLYDRFAALEGAAARHGRQAMIGGGAGWQRRRVLL